MLDPDRMSRKWATLLPPIGDRRIALPIIFSWWKFPRMTWARNKCGILKNGRGAWNSTNIKNFSYRWSMQRGTANLGRPPSILKRDFCSSRKKTTNILRRLAAQAEGEILGGVASALWRSLLIEPNHVSRHPPLNSAWQFFSPRSEKRNELISFHIVLLLGFPTS
jgi:hypothetical protein